MQTSLRYIGAMALLLLGIVLLYGRGMIPIPGMATAPTERTTTPPGTYDYIADLDFWQRTPRETSVQALARFDLDADLTEVPLTVGPWVGQEMPETNQEVLILLDPEQYVQRLYQDDQGRYIWLSMVGGRSSQPFHAPDICYDADGWQYNLGSHPTPLPGGGAVYGLWLEATKQFPDRAEPTKQIVYYFYLFPDGNRNLSDGIVLFKLTSSQYGSVEETLEMQGEFIRRLFTAAISPAT